MKKPESMTEYLALPLAEKIRLFNQEQIPSNNKSKGDYVFERYSGLGGWLCRNCQTWVCHENMIVGEAKCDCDE